MSIARTGDSPYIIYGPMSANSQPTIVLHLHVDYSDMTGPPLLRLYTALGRANPDTYSSMSVENDWHKIVLPSADRELTRLESDTLQLFDLAFSDLTEEDKALACWGGSWGDQVREALTTRTLSMIMSEVKSLLRRSQKLKEDETLNARILGYKNLTDLTSLMRRDERLSFDYTACPHVRIDSNVPERLEELQSTEQLIIHSTQP